MKPETSNAIFSPLKGTNLIEASAGTGKTYAITGLFLRLLLEKGLRAEQILVVTYTVAATEELKGRIRTRIREALTAFESGDSEDPFLAVLLTSIPDAEKAKGALRLALLSFDLTAIHTIHGFCMRVLQEEAFETGSLFDTELIPDQRPIIQETVEDFWRRHIYGASPLFVRFVLENGEGVDSLMSLLGPWITHPYATIIPEAQPVDLPPKEQSFLETFERVRRAWAASKEEVEQILVNQKSLSRTQYKPEGVPLWVQAVETYFSGRGYDPKVVEEVLAKFSQEKMAKAVKKDQSPPFHPLFDQIQELVHQHRDLHAAYEQHLLSLKGKLFRFMELELPRRKRDRNVMSFEDLLRNFHGALKGEKGHALISTVRKKYRAALIDEFQDTDPIQYAIFRTLFDTPEATLFLVGDPKQAIYGFRGADLFAYLDASRTVKARQTLKENWRSEPGLIQAVNTVFGRTPHPFVYEGIDFEETSPAPKKKVQEPLILKGRPGQGLELWFLEAGRVREDNKPLTKEQAYDLIPDAVAGEIFRLLMQARDGKVLLGERPLRESDMAVLVRTNREGTLMQEALSRLRIPSVLYSTGNLFDSQEAMEMERVLSALSEPSSEWKVRAALVTDLIGLKGEMLYGLKSDPGRWEQWLVCFREYHDQWSRYGFIRMFRGFLERQEVLPRLMGFPNGERRATNLLHLTEVMHREERERQLHPSGLLKWLRDQRNPTVARLEEHQLRLESDEKAVKVVTIHRSKGLEYPLVFCPFSWTGSRMKRKGEPLVFHDVQEGNRLTVDMAPDGEERHRRLAQEEALGENLRLLYVALTRAKNRCYGVWGKFNGGGTSAWAYLLHGGEEPSREDLLNALDGRYKQLADEELLAEAQEALRRGGPFVTVRDFPEKAQGLYTVSQGQEGGLRVRPFSGDIVRDWGISSYSSLLSGSPRAADEPDLDPFTGRRSPEGAEMGVSTQDFFSFPKGAKTGTFLHDLLEHLDFTAEDPAHHAARVAEKLLEYGFDSAWEGAILSMIHRVVNAPLDPAVPGLLLRRIPWKDRQNEVGFYFPLRSISAQGLGRIFSDLPGQPYGDLPERIGRLTFSRTRGFMKGFIDMVFHHGGRYYLLDWKSNDLGPSAEDYGPEALKQVMVEEGYVLQYHLYLLALNQYLKRRLPGYDYEPHFGGVIYVFLRGVDPGRGPDLGIFRDRPPKERILFLTQALMDLSLETQSEGTSDAFE